MTDTHYTIAVFHSQLAPCSYLPGRQSANLVIDPRQPITPPLYNDLLDHGFRRSGPHIYRPHCPTCDACVPVRVPVARFTPDRSQRRTWQRNHDLQHISRPAQLTDEQYALYLRYQRTRHPDGGMADTTPEQCADFLTAHGLDTRFHEFRSDGRLALVAVTDHVPRGLSAVYTFFDPDTPERSLGTWAVLWQIRTAQALDLPWLYLGYWIAACRKMRYKARFQPLQTYHDGEWREMATDIM